MVVAAMQLQHTHAEDPAQPTVCSDGRHTVLGRQQPKSSSAAGRHICFPASLAQPPQETLLLSL
jgi:hypothetical protein